MVSDSSGAAGVKKPGAYHHGNLRSDLVAAARRQIDDDGVAALSLRKVGRQLGVSQAALYNHFADKAELLAAVAAQGFRELARAQAGAEGAESNPALRVSAQGTAYVRFAMAQPNLYRLMFGEEVSGCADYPELKESRKASFELINEAVRAQLARCPGGGDDAYLAVVAARVTVHGLASLLINGLLTPSRTLTPDEQNALIVRINDFFARSLDAFGGQGAAS